MTKVILKRKPGTAPIGQNGQTRPSPVPRLCGREEFRAKAERLGMAFYCTGPPGNELFTAQFISARFQAGIRKDLIKT